MYLPSKIYIGYRTLSIYGEEGLTMEENSLEENSNTVSVRGYVSHDKGVLKYDADLEGVELSNTLLHEVIHGCLHNSGIHVHQGIGENEELIVEGLTNSLTDFIKRNPKFMCFILGKTWEKDED